MKKERLGGYAGRVLRVNLSNGVFGEESLGEEGLRKFVGGTGVGAAVLYDRVPPGVEPYDPANLLIFASGPLNGTRAPGSGTYSVVTKGPLTNLAVAAQANGFFGAKLKFAGFDAIAVEGAAERPVYLIIESGRLELRDARHLAGKDTTETEELLKKEVGDSRASVACIGPSGENLVRFAAICSDKGHVAATGGVGAVMGSKKLKAIVVNGRQQLYVRNRSGLSRIARQWVDSVMQSPAGALVANLGTAGFFSPAATVGWLPVKNLTSNSFPEHPRFNGDYLREKWKLVKHKPCYACPLTHCRIVQVTEGPQAGLIVDEPEYECLAAWGSNIGVTDPGTAARISDLNDRLGMDVKEAGFLISLLMECFEKGLISLRDTDGLELRWGNAEAVISMLEKIARRDGFGHLLAEGVMRTAETLGGEIPNMAVYMKRGIAPHIHDPRGMWGILLSQAVSDMGSMQAKTLDLEPDPDLGYPEVIPAHSSELMVKAQVAGNRRRQFEDTLVLCMFVCRAKLDILVDALNAVTGWTFQKSQALEVGERIVNLLRAFNVRHGFTPEEDSISPRIAEAPVNGPAQGVSIAPSYAKMVQDYYQEMGWEEETGKPLSQTLKKLDLGYVAKDLW